MVKTMTESLQAIEAETLSQHEQLLTAVFGEPQPEPVHAIVRPEFTGTIHGLSRGETIALSVACVSLILGVGKVVRQIRKV